MGLIASNSDSRSENPQAGDVFNITEQTVDRQVALGNGSRSALCWIDRRRIRHILSYAELADAADRMASVLTGLGIGQGDVVAVLLPKIPEFAFAALGAWKVGAVFAPILPSLGPGPVASRLEISRAKILITTSSLYEGCIVPQLPALTSLTNILKVDEDDNDVQDANCKCVNLKALMAKANPEHAACARTATASPAFLHFTSGTTGTPKGTIHGHGTAISLKQSAVQMFGLKPEDVYWCTAEPGWMPCTAYGIIAPFAVGCVAIMDFQEFDAQRWYSILVEEQVTVWYTTPTSIRMMMRFGAALARSYRKFALRIAASGGEPLNAEAVAWGRRALGTPFLDSWWQTETGSILIANQPDNVRPGSMGLPLPGVEIALIKRTASGLVPVVGENEVGELAIKAELPSMFIDYANEPDRHNKAIVDGWYLTGDHVRQDADKFLWFIGRCDDLIKYKGQFIGPFELENTLLDHPAVAEAAVVGKPDPIPGHIPVAFVTLNPGFEPGESLHHELLEFSQKVLGTIAPKEIYFHDNIPKTMTGCILRRLLREQMTTFDPSVELHYGTCSVPREF